MQRFSASIVRCPEGYHWENVGGYGPEDGDLRYAESLALRPSGDRDLWLRWSEEGGVPSTYLYDPFIKEPALFRIFAMLKPTQEAVLEFANNYGDIALYANEFFDGNDDLSDGASLKGWRDGIEMMRDWVVEADELVRKQTLRRERQKHTQAVADFVDEILSTVPVFMKTTAQNGVAGIRAYTYTLFDAMKLQLVDAIVEQKKYRACENCGKPFETTPQVNRSDRIYCSDNCRVKAYQRRRKQAIELRHAGRTLREIAKAVGSDMPTVKKWVSEIDE